MTGPVTTEALAEALSDFLAKRHPILRWQADASAIALIAGPLAPLLAAHQQQAASIGSLEGIVNGLEAALQQVTAERDEAREERDALRQAAGFKPGSFETALSREVILGDIAGMRPAMVEARRAADRVQCDADLWTMRMLEEWPGDTLLLRLWRQRREATKAERAAEAALATATSELARLRAEGEAKDRRIALADRVQAQLEVAQNALVKIDRGGKPMREIAGRTLLDIAMVPYPEEAAAFARGTKEEQADA